VEISGQHIVENNTSLKTGRHTFVLTAEEESFPMPAGATDSEKKVTISSNENFSFGNIHFDRQGQYSYVVTRILTKSKNLKEDDSVYEVKVAVFNDGEVAMAIKKDGDSGKADKIIYKDTYVKNDSSGGKSSQTGDDFNQMAGAAMFVSALLIIIAFSRRKKEE